MLVAIRQVYARSLLRQSPSHHLLRRSTLTTPLLRTHSRVQAQSTSSDSAAPLGSTSAPNKRVSLPDDGPSLADFIKAAASATPSTSTASVEVHQDLDETDDFYSKIGRSYASSISEPNAESTSLPRRVFVETYGCQMNSSDTEIVQSILGKAGYLPADSAETADVVLLNTCAIRDNAENKVWTRLRELKAHRKPSRKRIEPKKDQVVGVLGCMAERLKERLLETEGLCQVVAGPDSYRDLPRLLSVATEHENAINVMLSQDETYADISPVRTTSNSVSAYVSIMRGCNNMCSFCIVPFTRGRERSRPVDSILREVHELSQQGFKEVVLLGQNVNSYNDLTTTPTVVSVPLAPGFATVYKAPAQGVRFPELLQRVAQIDPEMRVRFTSPHPKDFPVETLSIIRDTPNVCKQLHVPAQSGSTNVLTAMRRNYSREAYLDLIQQVRTMIPGCAISSDFISGFCGETEEDHRATLSLLELVAYEHAFMFAYSMREKTHAHRKLVDDVPEAVKSRRLNEVINTFHTKAIGVSQRELGKQHLVLIDGVSKRSSEHFVGRTDSNKRVVFPMQAIPDKTAPDAQIRVPSVGDYVHVAIVEPGITLHGEPQAITSLQEFASLRS